MPSGSGVAGVSPGQVNFTANARSAVIDEGVVAAKVLSLRGADGPTVRFSARVADASGRDLGVGTVAVSGLATIRGDLTITSVIVVKNASVSLGDDDDPAEVDALGGATVDGAKVTFARHRDDGPPEEPVQVTGPIRLRDGAQMTVTGGVEWTSSGPIHATSRARSTVTWAGDGTVKLADNRNFSSSFGGVKGTGLSVLLSPGPVVGVNGQLQAHQIYADGVPQLRASAAVSVKRAPGPVRSGGRGEFTWAPYNGGATDMVISSIRPANNLARSVNLALEKMPAMCGAEACPFGSLGGDTAGLGNRGGLFGGGASPINAVILPGTGDEREISFNLPDGVPPGPHEMVLVMEGNFDPVTVRIPLTVSG